MLYVIGGDVGGGDVVGSGDIGGGRVSEVTLTHIFTQGGHFAALEQPQSLASDIVAFFLEDLEGLAPGDDPTLPLRPRVRKAKL